MGYMSYMSYMGSPRRRPPPLRPRPFPYMSYIGGNEGLSLPTTED